MNSLSFLQGNRTSSTVATRYSFTPLYLRLWPYWERELQLDFMWHQQFSYPDGRVQFRTTVPNVIATWVITAIAVSRLTGFGVVQVPFIYEGTRQFFIKVEVPPIVRLGEQIGARVDVFNFQTYRIEALIILHASDNYRFVNLDDNGVVSSYAPRLTDGQHHVLVILYPNEVRRLYLPFVPIVAGEVEVMIEGKLKFIRSQTNRTNPSETSLQYQCNFSSDMTGLVFKVLRKIPNAC